MRIELITKIEKLEDLSNITWKELQNRPKATGYETIRAGEMKKIYSKINIISDDTKLIVFRFNKGIYRLIGLKSVESNIFNILAIDWDFSLYNHGR